MMGYFLPEVKDKMSPKGLDIWRDFVYLRRLRHRIIHLKLGERPCSRDNNPYPESIWSQLFHSNQQNLPLTAKNVMKYFKEGEYAYWLDNCPL